jgi:hypothetical protein
MEREGKGGRGNSWETWETCLHSPILTNHSLPYSLTPKDRKEVSQVSQTDSPPWPLQQNVSTMPSLVLISLLDGFTPPLPILFISWVVAEFRLSPSSIPSVPASRSSSPCRRRRRVAVAPHAVVAGEVLWLTMPSVQARSCGSPCRRCRRGPVAPHAVVAGEVLWLPMPSLQARSCGSPCRRCRRGPVAPHAVVAGKALWLTTPPSQARSCSSPCRRCWQGPVAHHAAVAGEVL